MVQIIIKKARTGGRPALKLMKVYPNEQYLDPIPSFAELDVLVDSMLVEAKEPVDDEYDLLLDGVPLTNANTVKRLSALGANAHVVLKLCPSSAPSTRTPSPRRSRGGTSHYSSEESDADDESAPAADTAPGGLSREQTLLMALETKVKEQFTITQTAMLAEKVKKLLTEFRFLKFAINRMSSEEYEVVARGMLLRTKQVHDLVVDVVVKTNPTVRKLNLSLEFVGNITDLENDLEIKEGRHSLAMVNIADKIVSLLNGHANLMKDVCKDAKKMEGTLDDILFFTENSNALMYDDIFESAKYVMSFRRGLADHMAAISDICLKPLTFRADFSSSQDKHAEQSPSNDVREPGDVPMTIHDVPVADGGVAGLPRVIRLTLPWAKCAWATNAEINMAVGINDTVGDVRARLAQVCKEDVRKIKIIANISAILPSAPAKGRNSKPGWSPTCAFSASTVQKELKACEHSPLSVTLEDQEPLPDIVVVRGLDNPLMHYIKWHPRGAILMRDQAVAMQQELYQRFCTPHFQEGLLRIKETVGDQSPRLKMRLQQAILFNEQKEVLPKYGFEAHLDCVQLMITAINEFLADEVVGLKLVETAERIDAIIEDTA